MRKPVLQSLLRCDAAFRFLRLPLRPTCSTEPRVDLRVEQNDNLNLDPVTTSDSDVLGYIAEMDLLMDIATPRGETSLRPRVRFQDYPDRDDFERFEGFLDMLSRYEWERSTFEFDGNFSHQDLYNSDTPGGGFDPLDPAAETRMAALRRSGKHARRWDCSRRSSIRLRSARDSAFGADYLAARYDADEGASDPDRLRLRRSGRLFVLGARALQATSR